MPVEGALSALPWWAWIGGVLGATFVTVSIIAAPRIGAAALVAIAITGQLAAALVLDHHGWLGYPQKAVTWARVVGVGLLVAGAALVRL